MFPKIVMLVSNVILWMIFGFLSKLLNCDLQRSIRNNTGVLHVMAFLALFYLFTLVDTDSKNKPVLTILKDTILLYVFFIMVTKSKWYVVWPLVLSVVAMQLIKHEYDYRKEHKPEAVWSDRTQAKIMNIGVALLIVLSISGVVDYYLIQKAEHSSDFTFIKFIFKEAECKLP
jgi:hypothetical protein